jgi:hypothetical protein
MFAINISPSEDTAVPGMFKNGRYSYPALRVPEQGWAGEMYNIHSAPQNYLIDGSGRLILELAFDTEEERAISERAIDGLMQRQGR